MEAKYKQAAEFVTSLEDAFINDPVKPNWIADTSCFWYEKELTKVSFTFFLVNAETGKIGPAFDHEALSNALSERDIQATATTLPFREFEMDTNLTTITFDTDDESWKYECDSNELSIDAAENQDVSPAECVEPLGEEFPSLHIGGDTKCSFAFINKRSTTIRVWWIDHNGEPQMSKFAEPGQTCRRKTISGHVWRVCDDETGNEIASYLTPQRETAFAIIAEDKTAPSEETAESDTDSQGPCIVKDFNVYIRKKGSADVQLSSSGSKNSPFDPEEIHHSQDNKYACVFQYTPHQQRTLYRIESTPEDQLFPRLKEKQYLRPGDKIQLYRPRLFDLVQGKEILTSDVLFSNPYGIHDFGWSPDNQKYRFFYNERGHKIVSLVELDINSNARVLIEERQSTFVDYSQKIDWHHEEDTDELVWLSERDGSNHLYLFRLDGPTGSDNLLVGRQLTWGAGNIKGIEHVDNKERQIYVSMLGAVAGQDPYYKHLVRVGMDDSSFTILTNGDGNHNWTWSPDHKYFVDKWSRVDKPYQTVLRDHNGRHILDIDEMNIENLTSTGWRAPERFTAPGRDGRTPIYGIIIKPSDFSPDKRYPVIEKIYAGPQNFFVPKYFSKLTKFCDLAEHGFIVVQIDGMGTNWRCRTFHEVCYQNLKDAGLPDRIAWLKAAAKTRPWMDLTRVGILGGSAGGQNALAALLWHGDFYKAAIADCGCHDNRLDKLWWNELWMGWPITKAYEDNSNVVHAHRLTGALMLIVGELDSNVDPASTLQVVHALNKAGKDYELLFVPGARHVPGGETKYLLRRQRDFLVKHLIGADIPRWNTAEVRERLSALYDG